jgi:cardiolipin synthase
MPSWSLLIYIGEWIIRLVMLFVIVRKRRPQAAVAWLLVIFFMPEVGLVLYLLIGEYRLPRRRVQEHARLLDQFHQVERTLQQYPNIVRPDLGPAMQGFVRLAEQLGAMPILGGNEAELINDTDNAIERLIADIDQAKHHVHLLFYIYSVDQTGQQVSEALIRAAQRGVHCRVIADAVGSRALFGRLAQRMKQAGVQVQPALPVNPLRLRVARVDVRNHRKIAVIDGHIAYTGSQNIVNADYGHKDLAWEDLMARFCGPVVLELQEVFLQDWFFETNELLDAPELFPETDRDGDIAIQVLPSGPNAPVQNYQRMVVAGLHAAQKQATLTTPYFVPDEAFLQAMQTAVLRGVEVRLIVPARSNMKLVTAAGAAYFEELLEEGVRVFQYTSGLLHTKAISIDDEVVFIGSSNFDIRSFVLNFEVNLLCYGKEMTRMLLEQQEAYIDDAVELQYEQWCQRPRKVQYFQNIAKLLSPLL